MSDQADLPKKTPLEWLAYADGDFRSAEYLITSELPAYHTICFLCQSSAEKYLKAYLLAQGWKLEKTHDLLILINRCSSYDSKWSVLLPEGQILNAYIVAGRYPSDLAVDDIGKPEAEEAIRAAQTIRTRVSQYMGDNSSEKETKE